MTQKLMAAYYHLQNKKTHMNSLKSKFSHLIIITLALFLTISCQRAPSCPAYNSVDPSQKNLRMSKEKFMNPVLTEKPEDNKKKVEKQKKADLKAPRRGKQPYNLFPSYMR
jgi:hypothetical protein